MAKSLSISEKASYATNAFASIGIGKEAAFGILGSLAGESGRGLNTHSFNAKDPNGGSVGIAQWHSERRTGMENFNSKWGNPKDYRHQIDYVVHELKTTHKGVAEKLRDPDITRSKAATVWTRQYEVPAKAVEHLAERKANANYFANLDKDRPKSPQAAIDMTSPYRSLEAINAATAALANGQKVGLTGAVVAGQPTSVKATAYVDPVVNAAGAKAAGTNRAGAYSSTPGSSAGRSGTQTADQHAGRTGASTGLEDGSVDSFGEFFSGLTDAIGGVVSGVTGFAQGLGNLDPQAAFAAMPGGPVAAKSQEVATDAANKAKEAGTATKAAAQTGISGFLNADTTVAGFLGTMVGGYFGGPLGAIAGGLAGQGIDKALSGMSKDKATELDKEKDAGLAGGIGRAVDGFFGGVNSMFSSGFNPADVNTLANPNGISFDANGFPSAPDRPSGSYDSSNFSESDQQAASDWASSNPDVASSPGLY